MQALPHLLKYLLKYTLPNNMFVASLVALVAIIYQRPAAIRKENN